MAGFDRPRRNSRTRELGLNAAVFGGAAASANGAIIGSGIVDQTVNLATPFDLDLDGDADVDYRIFAGFDSMSGLQQVSVQDPENFPNGINGWLDNNGDENPDLLMLNEFIDGGNTFFGFGARFLTGETGIGAPVGEWLPPYPTNGFFGVEFDISGQTHYGWVELTATGVNEAVINQWAYEDVPNTGIAAGVPAPGSVLLLGAALLSAGIFERLRRRKSESS